MRAQSPRQRASRLGRDSMGRPVWNRTYSAVIPCIVFACSHLPHHRISTAQKGHGCPFSTRALVFYHTLLENATSFSKKVRANSRKSELFSGNRFWKNLTTRCSGFPRLTRRAAGRPPRQSPANRRVNARSSPGRGLPDSSLFAVNAPQTARPAVCRKLRVCRPPTDCRAIGRSSSGQPPCILYIIVCRSAAAQITGGQLRAHRRAGACSPFRFQNSEVRYQNA